jgi:hypothetical protein
MYTCATKNLPVRHLRHQPYQTGQFPSTSKYRKEHQIKCAALGMMAAFDMHCKRPDMGTASTTVAEFVPRVY